MNYVRLSALGILVALSILSQFSDPALARQQYTITQRQERLLGEINKDERNNELTRKEADGLRSSMQHIQERIDKMKSKNGGKLSYKDEGKIEKDLNDVSLKLKKLELNKRVEAK